MSVVEIIELSRPDPPSKRLLAWEYDVMEGGYWEHLETER